MKPLGWVSIDQWAVPSFSSYLPMLLYLSDMNIRCETTAYQAMPLILKFPDPYNISIAPITHPHFLIRVASHIIIFRGAVGTKDLSTLPTMVFPLEEAEVVCALTTFRDTVCWYPLGSYL